MTIPWPVSRTPYVVPDGGNLASWPTGVSFGSIPPGTGTTPAQKTAALANICLEATSEVDSYVNFPLHAVLNTETETGPNYRLTIRRQTGMARMVLSRWPVTNIVSVRVAPANVFPRQWVTVPAGFWQPEYPVVGHYGSNAPTSSGEGGQAILIAPGYVNWCLGRWGFAVQVQYTHGWPHTHLTASAVKNASTLTVADCTAWAPFAAGEPGAGGIIYDITGGQEPVSVTAASATSGPGTVTLASALSYPHDAGIMVSALPSNAIWATALFAAGAAMTRGATSTTVQSIPGHLGATPASLTKEAKAKLRGFCRTI